MRFTLGTSCTWFPELCIILHVPCRCRNGTGLGYLGYYSYNRGTRLGVSRYLFGGRGEGRSRVSRYLVRVRPGYHAPAPCKPPLDPFSAAKVVRNRPFILSTKRAGLDFAAFIASALCAPWTIANPR